MPTKCNYEKLKGESYVLADVSTTTGSNDGCSKTSGSTKLAK
jgi:hypothetical protein